MFEQLTGENILLRKARPEDWQSMLKNVWSDERVYRWMLYQPTFTPQDAQAHCQRSILFQKEHFGYFVALKETDEAIGLCAIKEEAPGHFEESGICIGVPHQSRGYGREIVFLLLGLAFEKLGAEDFRYGYFQDNLRSKKLAEHFGFVFDRSFDLVRPWDGALKRIDSCILTREEYLKRFHPNGTD